MTAPFTVDAGNSRLSLNPGPWGVGVVVRQDQATGAVITLTPDQATRLAAALILATAHAVSYRSETVSQAT